MNRIPSILVNTGFPVDQNGALTELIIPNVVTTLNAPRKVTFMGETINWLPATSSLQMFSAPNMQSYFNSALLAGKTALTEVSMGINTLGIRNSNQCFTGCTSLASITLDNLTTIDDNYSNTGGSFMGCTSLVTINLPSLLSIISCDGVFKNCTALTTFKADNATTITGYGVFNGCTSLQTLNLPKIKYLTAANTAGNTSYALFKGSTALTDVTLGSADNPVTSISNNVFGGLTQSGLTITIYTSGGAALSGSPWGATNATIVWEEA